MDEVKFTLLGDGSSDKALIPVVKWLLNELYPQLPTQIVFADFRELGNPPTRSDIQGQFECAMEYYPFDILIYHRDAETNDAQSIQLRKNEVFSNIDSVDKTNVICLVPVRMMETWLLINADAIKCAAGNRNFAGSLNLPPLNRLEAHSNPKNLLLGLIKEASGLRGRRLASFNERRAVHLVAEYIEDFSPLSKLQAFTTFREDLQLVVNNLIKRAEQ